ncbi:MAG: tyrosine-type recombinase/integrase [Actinomycetota bacterium]
MVREVIPTAVNLRPSTRARDESYASNHITPIFGECSRNRIAQPAVREWIMSLKAKRLAPATIRHAYQILSRTMDAAVDAGIIAISPCRNIPLPRIVRHEMRFLSPEEVKALADSIDPRYEALVWLGAYAGLRRGELFGLKKERFDQLRSQVEVVETLVEVKGHLSFGPPKTSAGRRIVPIPRSVADIVSNHLATRWREGNELVFQAPKGGPIRATLFRRRFWETATEKAELDGLRMHDLRHTAVAFWIAAGAHPKEIARWAGHTSVSVVLDRYGHVMPTAHEKVTARLQAMIDGRPS